MFAKHYIQFVKKLGPSLHIRSLAESAKAVRLSAPNRVMPPCQSLPSFLSLTL